MPVCTDNEKNASPAQEWAEYVAFSRRDPSRRVTFESPTYFDAVGYGAKQLRLSNHTTFVVALCKGESVPSAVARGLKILRERADKLKAAKK